MRPLIREKVNDDDSDEEKSAEESEESEEGNQDLDAPHTLNKPVDRLDLKTTAQRNRDMMHKIKM